MVSKNPTTYATYRLTTSSYADTLTDKHGHVCIDKDENRYLGPVGDGFVPLGLLDNLGGMGALEDLEELTADELADHGYSPDDFDREQTLEERLTFDDADDRPDRPTQDCLDAAIDWYHDNLTDDHRDLLKDKWGIEEETVRDLRIGFSGDQFGALVDYLRDEGFDDATILQSGVASSRFVTDVLERTPDHNRSKFDSYSDELQDFIKKRASGNIRADEIDMEAVIEYGEENGEYNVGAWWNDRIVFPYYDADEDARYLIGRRTETTDDIDYNSDDPEKPPEIPKYLKLSVRENVVDTDSIYEPLYGLHTVEEDKKLILTEGITDAISAHQAGFACVSPVTKNFKAEHHGKLLEQAEKAGNVYLVFDNEEPAQDGSELGEGLAGALNVAGFLRENDVDVRVTLLPRPDGTEKVDLADYLKTHDPRDLTEELLDAVKPDELDVYDPDEYEGVSRDAEDTREFTAVTSSSDDAAQSALWDVGIEEATGHSAGYRGPNPIQHHGNSENYFVVYDNGTATDFKGATGSSASPETYNGLTFLVAEAKNQIAAPKTPLSDEDIFRAWKHAKEQGIIASDDPIPGKAMWHIARDHDLYPESMIPSGWDDDAVIAPSVKNRILEVVEDEYGVDPGREEYETPDGVTDTTPQEDGQTEIEARVEQLTPSELSSPPTDYPVYDIDDTGRELHVVPTATDTVLLAVVDNGEILSELPGVEYTPGGGDTDVDTPKKRENRANDLVDNSNGSLIHMDKEPLMDALHEMGRDMQTDDFDEQARSPIVQSFIERTEDVVFQPYKGGEGTNWRITLAPDPRETDVGSKEFTFEADLMSSNGPAPFETEYLKFFGLPLPDSFGENEWTVVKNYWMDPDVRERRPVKYDSEAESIIDRFFKRVDNADVYEWCEEAKEQVQYDAPEGVYIEDFEDEHGTERDVVVVGGAWVTEWRQEHVGNFALYDKLHEYGYLAKEPNPAPSWLVDGSNRPQVLILKASKTEWTAEKAIDPSDGPEEVV